MVVHKIVQLQAVRTVAPHLIEPPDRVGDLKIIVIIVARVQGLVQVVVCYRVKRPLIDPAGIVPVDHLTHKPEIRPDLPGCVPKGLHVPKVQHVGGIQTDAVNVKLPCPETDHIADIVPDRRVVLV